MITKRLHEDSNYSILIEFVARFTGTLKDWWNTVDEPSKLQFLVSQDFNQIIDIFLGRRAEDLEVIRKEYFQMRCLSSRTIPH